MRIDYNWRENNTASASEEAAGYPATNALLNGIGRPWRSTTTGAITFTFSTTVAATVVWLQHTNILACTINGVAATLATEPNGRRKARAVVSSASSFTVSIDSGSPTDAYWFIGAVHGFGASQVLDLDPRFGLKLDNQYPGVARRLANGKTAIADAGPAFVRLEGTLLAGWEAPGGELVRQARASGVVGVDLQQAARPDLMWPMRFVDTDYEAKVTDRDIQEWSFAMEEWV